MKSYRTVIFAVVLLWCAGCSGQAAPSGRAGWLQSTLVEDNRLIIEREPALMRGKFAKMATSPYYFFRGTSAQFVRDLTDAQVERAGTEFGSARASAILLTGDPHPENLGTYLSAAGRLTVEINDFDGARYGPFHFDVRRLATGFGVAAETIGEPLLGAGIRDRAIEAVARGYVDEIDRLATGEAPLRVTATNAGPILQDLIERARDDGDEREALQDYTRVRDGRRELYFGEVDPPDAAGIIGDEVVEVSERERRMVARLVAAYPPTLAAPKAAEAFRIKGVGRRLGAGVASYALLRYYVLVEGPTDAVDDDWLLEVKESRDAASIPGLVAVPPRSFTNNAQRAVFAQRAMQLDPQNDALLGWAALDTASFKMRERSKYQKGVDVPDIAEGLADGDWQADDFVALARTAGRLLARSHTRAGRRDGGDALAAIAEVLDGRQDAFVAETTAFATAYTDRVLADHALFVDLLESEGPLLGARPLRELP